jgi:diguanylate cyclase (GGDEF)-like protein
VIGRTAALGTRVARRVLSLFAVCALLPVATTLLLSHGRVRDALVDERVGQLGHAAETFGTTLLERLYLADQLTRSMLPNAAAGRGVDEGLARYFLTIAVVRPAAAPQQFVGNPARLPPRFDVGAVRAHLAAGEATLLVLPASDATRTVWLARALDAARPDDGLLVAELSPAYLWGDPDELPYLTSICVLDAARRPLYCPDALAEPALAAIRVRLDTEPAGHLEWAAADGTRVISAYREVFLTAKFRAASWPIVASQPAEHALAPARAVSKLVIPALALGLLIAAFLGLVKVRRTMGPLGQLTEATKRIAARDFAARVPVTHDDEFGELAQALNAMSERLGRQFHALEALAQVDSVLLSKVDIDRIAAIVLGRMKEVAHADWRALLLADGAAPGQFKAHTIERAPASWYRDAIALPDGLVERLLAAPRGLTFDAQELTEAGEPAPAGAPRGKVLGLPIALDGRLAGLIVLGFPGDRAPAEDEVSLLRDLADRVAVALATAARDQALYRSAHYDALTQLPNRSLFLGELARELARAERQGSRLALLFIDLDGFSHVNDSLGHAIGDELLVRAADRLRSCVRKADVVARLGGDEFTVVLPALRDTADAATVARHVIETLSQPYDIGHGETFVSASVGIAVFPTDGISAQELLQHADMAMYRAKSTGRGSHAFFEEAMNQEARERLALDRELRHALEHGQLVLYYQPQLELRSNRIVGAEALIRWQHPTRGLVAPGPFIGFAEETGLIEQIGEWVLRAACAQFVAWRQAGVPIDHVSVNVSPRQFRGRDFAQTVAQAVRQSGMEAARLRLEITESVLVDDSGAVEATLERLRELGTPLELDDFGTGYSSLAYLRRLPVETIKLDRTFVHDITTNDNARAIARAAIGMVHALKKQIVAEGVETEEQAALLRRWGCDAIQGYYLAKPVPAERFVELVLDAAAARGAVPGSLVQLAPGRQ